MGILGQLSSYIQGLKLPEVETEWGDYYNFTNYKDESFQAKKRIIEGYRDRINPKTAWDLGANRGLFSRIFSDKGIPTIAWDIDPIAVDKNFNQIEKAGETSLLPLVVDLTNPSNSLGWANQERMSLEERGPVDVVMALALIHHISISNNVPFSKFAEYLSRLGNYLILEFVPKGDSQVDILLQTREDIFNQYDQKNFEKFFGEYFEILSKDDIVGSSRTLYLLKKKA
jgi:ribosomal protein L11 methylase PrmA